MIVAGHERLPFLASIIIECYRSCTQSLETIHIVAIVGLRGTRGMTSLLVKD